MGNDASIPMPSSMRRMVITQPHADITQAKFNIEEVPLPVPKSGEVLVKVTAAPVNPSDYGEWSHVRPDQKFEPKALGKEGSGVVVASGGGMYADRVVGKKVGFCNVPKGQGSYSEYVTVEAMKGIFPLPPTVEVEDAASHFVNPYTAYGFVDTIQARHAAAGGKGTPGLVNTAAASQLGQMLVKLCKEEKMPLVNVVRREAQAKLLRSLGAEHVIVSTEKGWEAKLCELMKDLNVTFAFDAVAGEMSGKLLDCLPYKGTLFVYGRLSNNGCSGIQPLDLIYRKKKLEGWFLTSWIFQDGTGPGGMMGTAMRLRTATARVHAGLETKDGWAASQFADCTLDTMQAQFVDMWKNSGFTSRKLRLRFDQKGDMEEKEGATKKNEQIEKAEEKEKTEDSSTVTVKEEDVSKPADAEDNMSKPGEEEETVKEAEPDEAADPAQADDETAQA